MRVAEENTQCRAKLTRSVFTIFGPESLGLLDLLLFLPPESRLNDIRTGDPLWSQLCSKSLYTPTPFLVAHWRKELRPLRVDTHIDPFGYEPEEDEDANV